ncbi:MAG: TRAP transporter substrate-binding protein [Candidatus Rokubacteria bacterium]|nr:TRAP transporter substrate-binding protein [Candidatus Rokubacteria bacterium]MBI2014590.1 TRAP transporter substrate-binding protein [Candidatus Rokubacteria bacterium]
MTRTRWTRWSGMAVVVAGAALALGAAPAAAQTYTLKIGNATINDVQHEWQKRWGARVEKRAGGRIKVEIYPASQIGSIPRMIEGLQLGTLEAWIGPPEFVVGHDPRFQVLAAPGVFDDMAHAYRVIGDPKFREAVLSLGEAKGMKGVSLIVYGPTSYATRKPIRKLDDFKGLKIRVFASPMQTLPLTRLGATAAPMPLSDVFPALQRGAIDGNRTGITIFTTFKYYDILKTVTETHDAMITSIAMVSKLWYDKLPPDLQKVLVEEGEAVQKELLDWTVDFNTKGRQTWTDKGGELIKLPAADQAELMKRLSTVGDEVVGSQPRLKEIYDLMVQTAKAKR